MRPPIDIAFLLRPYPTPILSVDPSWDVSPFSLGYVSCILIKPRWSSRESAYPSTSIACRFSMLSLWLGNVTGVHQKRDRATYLSRILLMFSPSFPGLSRFPTSLTLFGGVNDLPMNEPPTKKNLSNKHGKNRGIDKMKLVSKRGSSTCSL